MRTMSKKPKTPMTMINQFSRTGLQGSALSPKLLGSSPFPEVHQVSEGQEQTWFESTSDWAHSPLAPQYWPIFPAAHCKVVVKTNSRNRIKPVRNIQLHQRDQSRGKTLLYTALFPPCLPLHSYHEVLLFTEFFIKSDIRKLKPWKVLKNSFLC